MTSKRLHGTSPDQETGRLIAAALAGVWKPSPPPLSLSVDDLCRIEPALLATGAGGLAWWRIRGTDLSTTTAAARLRRTYHYYLLETAKGIMGLEQTITRLHQHGVEPLMAKGWAISRLYPDSGLRPYGDIDLCVPPAQYSSAEAALKGLQTPGPAVDLHRRFFELGDRALADLYRRSDALAVGKETVRVLGREDHLRLLCLHLVHHAVHRPLWLCDIGLFIESRPPGFDWDYFLFGDRKRTRWAAGMVLLAHALLGAKLDGVPASVSQGRLPGWLAPSVLKQWGRGAVRARPIGVYIGQPRGVLDEVRRRWPGALVATDAMRLPLNSLPRPPFQAVWFLWVIGSFWPRKAGRLASGLVQALLRRGPWTTTSALPR